jgi:hypothetical protein
MPNIFFVAQAVAPVGGSHSTRVTHLVAELFKIGWDVSVLTTKIYENTPNQDCTLTEKLPKDLKIYHSFPGPIHAMSYRKKNTCNSSNLSSNRPWKNAVFIPDTYFEWIPCAIFVSILKLRKVIHDADVIISSAVPYSCHLIALILSYLFRKPLVVDYGDPWVYDPGHPRKGFRYFIEKFMERRVLNHAKKVLVTTEETRCLYKEKYNLPVEKLETLSMAYAYEDFACQDLNYIKTQEDSNCNKIRFVYTGRLEPESRDIQLFFEALSELHQNGEIDNVVFIFAGVFQKEFIANIEKFNLKDRIIILPWMDHKTCMNCIARADYLLLFGNNNSIQLPGKLFNYIGSGNPIIYLSNNIEKTNDPAKNLLDCAGSYYHYVESSKKSIKSVISTISKNKKSDHKNIRQFSGFTWFDRAKELSNILKSIIKQ